MYSTEQDEDMSQLKNTTSTIRGIAGDKVKSSNKVLQFIQTAGGEFSHARDTVATQVRNHPLSYGAVALGVGVLLGALLSSRRRA